MNLWHSKGNVVHKGKAYCSPQFGFIGRSRPSQPRWGGCSPTPQLCPHCTLTAQRHTHKHFSHWLVWRVAYPDKGLMVCLGQPLAGALFPILDYGGPHLLLFLFSSLCLGRWTFQHITLRSPQTNPKSNSGTWEQKWDVTFGRHFSKSQLSQSVLQPHKCNDKAILAYKISCKIQLVTRHSCFHSSVFRSC